jgi:hypothetical protein
VGSEGPKEEPGAIAVDTCLLVEAEAGLLTGG